MRRHRKWILAVAVLATLALVVALWMRRRAPVPVARAAPQVALATVRTGTYALTVDATGSVGTPAGSQTKLAFAVPGILQRVDVRVGERIVAGQPLAQLNTATLALAAEQAQADARAAAAAAQLAAVDRTSTRIAVDEAALARARALYAAGVGARKQIDAALAQVAADRAEAAAARATIDQSRAQVQGAYAQARIAQRNYANGTLRAPVGGVVLAIYRRPGEAVDTSTPVLAIGPDAQNEITLAVPAPELQRVAVGDPVSLAFPGTLLHAAGRVSAVVPAVDPATQSGTAVVHGVPASVPAGAAVQATIVVGHDRGLLVPQSAVVQDPQTGATVVFVRLLRKDGTPVFAQRTVRVVHANGTVAQIGAGLRSGDRVAAQGAFELLAPASTGSGG